MRWRWRGVEPAVMDVTDSDCRDHQCVDCADAIAGAAGHICCYASVVLLSILLSGDAARDGWPSLSRFLHGAVV
jgi:hypothetical protein